MPYCLPCEGYHPLLAMENGEKGKHPHRGNLCSVLMWVRVGQKLYPISAFLHFLSGQNTQLPKWHILGCHTLLLFVNNRMTKYIPHVYMHPLLIIFKLLFSGIGKISPGIFKQTVVCGAWTLRVNIVVPIITFITSSSSHKLINNLYRTSTTWVWWPHSVQPLSEVDNC